MESRFKYLYNPDEMLLEKSKIFNKVDFTKRKTKIICTIGPSSFSTDTLIKMIDAGMDVARIVTSTLSYSDSKTIMPSYKQILKNFREAMRKRPNSGVGLMFTTRGPEILVGELPKKSEYLDMQIGDLLNLTCSNSITNFLNPNSITESSISIQPLAVNTLDTSETLINPENSNPNPISISCDYDKLPESVTKGGSIIFHNNYILTGVTGEIISIQPSKIQIKIISSGRIHSKTLICLPFADIKLPSLTSLDEHMIESFVLHEGIDILAVSFVRSKNDIVLAKDALGPRGSYIKIIAKIDNYLGICNFDEILEEADGVMIARGRLCLELPEEKLFQVQKVMIQKAKLAGKPVITSTQMLESMTRSLRPTLAEVTDVANAVLDGSDCNLLSNETSIGDFPIQSLEMMSRICVEAEQCIHYKKMRLGDGKDLKLLVSRNPKQESVCKTAVSLAEDINASLIIVITETGSTARIMAKYRPRQIILALCMSASVIRQLKITRGVITLKIPSFLGSESLIYQSILYAQENEYIKTGDRIVCILAENEETPDYCNTIKVTTL